MHATQTGVWTCTFHKMLQPYSWTLTHWDHQWLYPGWLPPPSDGWWLSVSLKPACLPTGIAWMQWMKANFTFSVSKGRALQPIWGVNVPQPLGISNHWEFPLLSLFHLWMQDNGISCLHKISISYSIISWWEVESIVQGNITKWRECFCLWKELMLPFYGGIVSLV